MYEYQNYLAHYGILGMKWGVRRSSSSLGGKVSRLSGRNTKLSSNVEKYSKKSRRVR